jgi:two-component system chemotaxis sensor kinase CheA
MKIDRDTLVKAFMADSEENLSTMEDALTLLEAYPEDEETIRVIFRGAHTLKGNASLLEFMELSELAHAVEDVLDRMRKQVLHATPELISLILRAVDLMRQMVPTVTDKQRQVPSELVRLMADLARRCSSSAGEGPTPAPAPDGAGAIAKGHGGR